MGYISLDFDGLSKTVAELVGGISTKVDTNGFANDLVTFRSRDDVLTLLIHLGYLAYNEETQTVYIPNEEIRREFARTIREVKRDEIRDKHYPDAVAGLDCDMLLVGINYDKDAPAGKRKHECIIESL